METGRITPFGLIGHPVGHSLSPVMQNAAFRACGLEASYTLLDVEPKALAKTLADCRAQGFGGVNITIPYKKAAFWFCGAEGMLSPTAKKLRAVNTIIFRPDGTLLGDNTDGDGFLSALKESFRITPRQKNILILGCGGAGQAIALTCAMQGAASICIANRDPTKQRLLLNALRKVAPGMPVSGIALRRAETVSGAHDLIIQATPVGMKPGDPSLLPAEAFCKTQMVMDFIYRPAVTPFLAAAKLAGARTTNGLGMLLHQGARAFQLWTGRKPPLPVMRKALEKAAKSSSDNLVGVSEQTNRDRIVAATL